MNGWLALLTAVLALLGTVLTTWITQRFMSKRAKSDDTQKLIDQLQEERDAADLRHSQELAGVRAEVSALRTEVGETRHQIDEVKSRAERRELVFFDYVAALRWHIDQGKGPPPPPWPAALMNRD